MRSLTADEGRSISALLIGHPRPSCGSGSLRLSGAVERPAKLRRGCGANQELRAGHLLGFLAVGALGATPADSLAVARRNGSASKLDQVLTLPYNRSAIPPRWTRRKAPAGLFVSGRS